MKKPAEAYCLNGGQKISVKQGANLAMAKIIRKMRLATDEEVSAGFTEDESQRKNEEDKKPINNATLGYIHETGSPARNIPARPFLRRTVEQCQEFILKELASGIAATIKNNRPNDVHKSLERIGTKLRDQAKNNIRNQDGFPLLSAATLRARKARKVTRTKALIDTGQLLNALTYKVEKRK